MPACGGRESPSVKGPAHLNLKMLRNESYMALFIHILRLRLAQTSTFGLSLTVVSHYKKGVMDLPLARQKGML